MSLVSIVSFLTTGATRSRARYEVERIQLTELTNSPRGWNKGSSRGWLLCVSTRPWGARVLGGHSLGGSGPRSRKRCWQGLALLGVSAVDASYALDTDGEEVALKEN